MYSSIFDESSLPMPGTARREPSLASAPMSRDACVTLCAPLRYALIRKRFSPFSSRMSAISSKSRPISSFLMKSFPRVWRAIPALW